MSALKMSHLTPEVSLPLQVALSGLGVIASQHPPSSAVSVFDDWVENLFISPELLALRVGPDLFALSEEGICDARGDVFYHSIHTLRRGSIICGGAQGVFDVCHKRKKIQVSYFCCVV